MPELPEVENITRGLKKLVVGKTVQQVDMLFPGLIKNMGVETFQSQICGKLIESVQRRGKYILVLFQENVLEVHLRMTGAFLFYPEPVEPGPYTRAVFMFQGKEALHYQDVRKFGTFRLWDNGELTRSPAYSLGLDPLNDRFSFFQFEKLLSQKPGTQLKSFLLNQHFIAGLGNIYVDEVLHQAKIHPARKINSLNLSERKNLFKSILSILHESIQSGGTSFSDYRDLLGKRGVYQEHLKVYQKENTPCSSCGSPLRRIKTAGRGTYLCLSCQKPGHSASATL